MTKFSYEATPETELFFELPDGHNISGILRGSLEDPLAVIVHGLGGRANEVLPYLGARYLWEYAGIASLRLSLYSLHPKTRNLLEGPMDIYTGDITAVVNELRARRVPKVYGIGHSLGGFLLLGARPNLDAAVLWDPSHGLSWQAENFDENPAIKKVGAFSVQIDGAGGIITAEQLEYIETAGDTSDWARDLGFPLAVIAAQKGGAAFNASYIEAADEPKQLTVLASNHFFDDSDAIMLQLFKETTDWLTRF